MSMVNAGARLDRLPVSSFHRRIMWLIGAGMFFDGFDLYLVASVLGTTLSTGFSTLAQNAQFLSATFLGMLIGAVGTGFLGDRYGRRFTYQINLLVFGLASLAAAAAPDMQTLIVLRFVIGIGLGAEIVVGYGTLTEFVPPRSRGRWLGCMAMIVVSGLPATSIVSNFVIPAFGWRVMFVIAGIGALIVWYLRKNLPESPRWLEAQGRSEEAEALLRSIEQEAAAGGELPPPATVAAPHAPQSLGALLTPSLLPSLFVGSVTLIVVNTLIFGFVTWLPTFFVQQGLSITRSLAFTMAISLGSPVGCLIGALSSDYFGRKPTIIGASLLTILVGTIYPFMTDPSLVIAVGVCLIVPIYILVATLYGVYTAEIFPTELRLRANGICNFFGRGATIVTPFIVIALFKDYGVQGVLGLMIGLLVAQIVVVWIWGPETRQRALEEVAASAGGGEAPTPRKAPA